jgi:hypothetical protein
VSGCQADLLDAEKQEVVTETALLAAEAKLGLLEGERTRAAEASFPSDSVRLAPLFACVRGCRSVPLDIRSVF